MANITKDNDFSQIIQSVFNPVSNSLNINPAGGNLVPELFDYISLSYTGSNLTGVIYKSGGSSGSTVATLTLAYDGSNNLTSVTKT